MDIIPQGVNKATGLKEFLAYLDVPRSELIAVGDGENDIKTIYYNIGGVHDKAICT